MTCICWSISPYSKFHSFTAGSGKWCVWPSFLMCVCFVRNFLFHLLIVFQVGNILFQIDGYEFYVYRALGACLSVFHAWLRFFISNRSSLLVAMAFKPFVYKTYLVSHVNIFCQFAYLIRGITFGLLRDLLFYCSFSFSLDMLLPIYCWLLIRKLPA